MRIIPKSLRLAVWDREQGRCAACGDLLHEEVWECHHRRLRSQGGRHEISNLVGLCRVCHFRAHSDRAEFGEPRGLIVPSYASWAATPVLLWDDRTVFLSLSYEVLPSKESA
jgi:hypothetical protein